MVTKTVNMDPVCLMQRQKQINRKKTVVVFCNNYNQLLFLKCNFRNKRVFNYL